MLYVKPTHGFNHVELPKYGYTHVSTKDEYGAVGINCTLFTKGQKEATRNDSVTVLLQLSDCSTIKDHFLFREVYLLVSPCFDSEIFLT